METAAISVLLGFGWFGCGLIAAGFFYAHFQRKYSVIAEQCRETDISYAWGMMLFGPIALAVAFFTGSYTFGWLFPGSKP